MNSVNKAIVLGNLGQDPETRVLPNGNTVTNLRIATSHSRLGQDNERVEETEWHSIVCFSKRAEIAAEHLRKGMQVYIEGRINTRSWDDKHTGEKKYRTEIIADNLVFISSTKKTGNGEALSDDKPRW
ncbi:single-stranded DNA-binding protein [uncultured Mediterranean phage]|nr:single-stranded DNA-binding protein [uncultured Mediterranean phage]